MKRFRSHLMSATLMLPLSLAALCACSAFVQISEAKELFNSPMMAVIWCMLLVGMLAGAMMIRNLRRNWPTMLAHLGGAMILAGALFASEAGVNLLNKTICKKSPIIRDAMIPLVPTQPNGQLVRTGDDGGMEPAGMLPGFRLRCNRALQFYYDAKSPRWGLSLEWTASPRGAAEEPVRVSRSLANDGTFVSVRTPNGAEQWEVAILNYLDPNVVPTAMLVLAFPDGRFYKVPLGKTFVELSPDQKLSVREVKAHFRLGKMPDGSYAEAAHSPGSPPARWNPASVVEFQREGAPLREVLIHNPANALALRGENQHMPLVMVLRPNPDDLETNRLGEPAVLLGFRRTGSEEVQLHWLAARPGEDQISIPMMLFETNEAYVAAGEPVLGLVRNQGVRRYWADVSVLDTSGKELTRHEMIVNDPLRYGGYQFSLQSFYNGKIPILRVRSTVGMYAIWLGFGLLLGGVFGGLWIRPLWQTIRRKGATQ